MIGTVTAGVDWARTAGVDWARTGNFFRSRQCKSMQEYQVIMGLRVCSDHWDY